MVTVQDLVDSSSRDDLVDQAAELEISEKREDGTKKSKAELAEDILAAEAAEAGDEPELTAPADEEGDAEPEVEDAQPEVQEAVAEVKEAEADGDADAEDVDAGEGDEVLVRFTGKHPVLQTEGFTFKRSAPFEVMAEDDAQRVFDGRYGDFFRVATPKEAREFYS